MDKLRLATLARGELGYHETEYSIVGEADLQKHLIICDKNADHKNFTPIQDFNIEQLPDGYKDQDIVDYIRSQADLTVRVTTTYISQNRPEGYAFYECRGKKFLRVGSGFMQYVYRNELRSNKPCPCPECKNSPTPRLEWAKLKIRTATHVVFDDEEAQNTIVEFFYDDNKGRDKVRYVYGESVAFGAIKGDWCDIRCVSHDIDLCEFLKDTWGRWRWLEMKVNQKFNSEDDHRLAVVVSHPHGCSKQVSIGVWRDRDIVDRSRDWENCVYTYDTPTCPGSSGAPVWILGQMKGAGFFGRHPHSGRPLVGLNVSAVGWDRKK
uniref:Peptidase S1 domain-containing protein n=1 Tax=Arion vulgaris TaxID=1028688 RepID=A0A0B7B952_9EUPU